MSATIDNVIPFPLHRRREVHGCPHCGKRDDVWQIGRLLWAYCDRHQVRWVVADYAGVSRATINRREMREGLEFLATFVEVSR
jgi:ribosomal protein L37AE/L43A